jgi:hypothetical protein
MHFLRAPKSMIHDKAVMDKEQTQVAANFVDELLDLGAVQTPAEGRIICTTAPLFVVPKEGQEGKWWVIVDRRPKQVHHRRSSVSTSDLPHS